MVGIGLTVRTGPRAQLKATSRARPGVRDRMLLGLGAGLQLKLGSRRGLRAEVGFELGLWPAKAGAWLRVGDRVVGQCSSQGPANDQGEGAGAQSATRDMASGVRLGLRCDWA
eukprot:8446205-Pyramimonas_sp.AAC.1